MNQTMDEEEYLNSETQLQQALALNKVLLDTLEKDRKDRRATRKVSIICATVCLVCVMAFIGVIVALASGIVIETTTTESTITQDTEGSGNNVYQAGEHATYSQSGGGE